MLDELYQERSDVGLLYEPPKLALGFNTRDLILRRYYEPAQWRTEKGTGPQKKKAGAESENPDNRDEAFTQEKIGKRREP